MIFPAELAFCCVAIFATLSSVDGNHVRQGEACLVQYLHNKEKLRQNIRSSQPATSQCRLITPVTLQVLKAEIKDAITKEIPDAADCLIEEFGNKATIDYLIQISVVEINEMLNETDRETQLEMTRNDLRKELKEIATHCETDDESFIKIFNENLGIKNESLAVLQHEYCLAKYVADDKIIDFGNVDRNPHHIDPHSVDCDAIVDADRRTAEKEMTDKIAGKVRGQADSNCVASSYRSNKIYDYTVGLNVLSKFSFSRETKEVETNRLTESIARFTLTIILECNEM